MKLTKKDLDIIFDNYKYFEYCNKQENCAKCRLDLEKQIECLEHNSSKGVTIFDNKNFFINYDTIVYSISDRVFEVLEFDEIKKLYNLRKL